LLLGAALTVTSAAQAPAAPDTSTALSGIKTIDNPSGGRIYLGVLKGQPTPAEAMGKVLQRVAALCGDRPRLGKLVKSTNGNVLAAFFTVTGNNLDGKPLEGLAIVYAPKTGAAGAVLLDDAARFPTTVNPMFTKLKEALGAAPSSGAAAEAPAGGQASTAAHASAGGSKHTASAKPQPPQPLQPYAFPDGTATIRLPQGWQIQHAQEGDVLAAGPHGETLRFGWSIPVMSDSRTASMGNFVTVPYDTAPADAFKAIMTQLYRKARKPAPTIDIAKVQDHPSQGATDDFLYGDIDAHDGRGQQYLLVRMISGPPQALGARQFVLFMVFGPQQVMGQEAATIASMYSGFTENSLQMNRVANVAIQQGIAQTNQAVHMMTQSIESSNRATAAFDSSYRSSGGTDSSDRATAGMSNILREQTVVVDTQTGGHATAPDDLAGALINANPNLFQAVSPSDYIRGIDY
jgi:hypothetical protein